MSVRVSEDEFIIVPAKALRSHTHSARRKESLEKFVWVWEKSGVTAGAVKGTLEASYPLLFNSLASLCRLAVWMRESPDPVLRFLQRVAL